MRRAGLILNLALGLGLALSACRAGDAGTPPGSTGGTGSPGTGGAGGTITGTGGAPKITLDCPQPALGAPSMRLLTRLELLNTLTDIFPEVSGQWSLSLPSNMVSDFGFDNDAGLNVVGSQFVSALTDTALAVATAVTGAPLANILPCSTSASDRTCADQFLMKYGRRLFRRPLTTAEHDRFLGFFDASLAKSDFKTALKWMAVGLIQSPNAVYRSETGTAMGTNGIRQLSPYEIASNLAYTFTASTPSDALLTQAASGSLGDPVAAAKALLATDRGKQVLYRFFDAYTDVSGVAAIQRPSIDGFSNLSADMTRETHTFVDQIVFQNRGSLKDLLTSPTTNPSRALATYYGFPAPASDFASITRPAGRGVGLLAQGSFLATHASSDSSSPTKRGLFPFRRLFCQARLTPPPDVPQIGQPQPGVKTTRQRYEEAHAGPANCASCHHQFDPIGFGFEHFDEGGRWRDSENGLAINAAATVTRADGSTLFSYDGQEQLVTQLANQPVTFQCFAGYLATYAFGSSEACLGSSGVAQLQAGTLSIADAFAGLAAEPHFTRRVAP